jgi:hypothetical protein
VTATVATTRRRQGRAGTERREEQGVAGQVDEGAEEFVGHGVGAGRQRCEAGLPDASVVSGEPGAGLCGGGVQGGGGGRGEDVDHVHRGGGEAQAVVGESGPMAGSRSSGLTWASGCTAEQWSWMSPAPRRSLLRTPPPGCPRPRRR